MASSADLVGLLTPHVRPRPVQHDLPYLLAVAGVAASTLALVGAGAAVGFLSGMFGVGGGFLITPILLFLGIPTEVAIATGANQAVATSVAGAMAQWKRGNVDIKIGGRAAGERLGRRLLRNIQLVTGLRRIGQFEVFVALSYVVLLGAIGILMLIESANVLYRTRATVGSAMPASRTNRHTWVHGRR